jgi:hypothetical protein
MTPLLLQYLPRPWMDTVNFLNIKAIHERTFIFTASGVIPAL